MTSRSAVLVLALSFAGRPLAAQDPSSGTELLARAVAYHDPERTWPSFAYTLVFRETRPGGPTDTAEVTLGVERGWFERVTTADGHRVVRQVDGERCNARVDGRPPTGREREQWHLSCDQLHTSRNYYLFLWGLPMKLTDPGTRVGEAIRRDRFVDRDVWVLRVTYDANVGTDTWYFYFAPDTYRLVGYRFYHDEAKGDGEYIVLDGEYRLGSLRIPARRSWYVNADGRLLGTDELIGHRPAGSH